MPVMANVSKKKGSKSVKAGVESAAQNNMAIQTPPDPRTVNSSPVGEQYVIQSRRAESDENAPIIQAAMNKDGHVKFRLNPQIYDADHQRYVGLLGQQFRLKVWTPEGVAELMDCLDSLIEAGMHVPMRELNGMIREYSKL
jgi:hypothetical protein